MKSYVTGHDNDILQTPDLGEFCVTEELWHTVYSILGAMEGSVMISARSIA